MMYAVLEHEGPVSEKPSAGGREVHWDLLVAVPGRERLATWRLSADPTGGEADVWAERIQDHRRVYLDYEGEISGGRGRVRRIDRGEAMIEQLSGERIRVRLAGGRLSGRFEIDRDADGRLVFRRVPGPAC
jgi:hypothetical protein